MSERSVLLTISRDLCRKTFVNYKSSFREILSFYYGESPVLCFYVHILIDERALLADTASDSQSPGARFLRVLIFLSRLTCFVENKISRDCRTCKGICLFASFALLSYEKMLITR